MKDVMKINEIFNTKIKVNWQISGRFELTSFHVDDIEYTIQIEKKPLHFDELLNKKTAEISFFRNDIDNTETVHSTTNDAKRSLSVYGAIANALVEKFASYDAFYFIANRRHSANDEQFQSKKLIYRFAADKMSKRTGAFFFIGTEGQDENFLVTKIRTNKKGYIIEAEEARAWFNAQGFKPAILK